MSRTTRLRSLFLDSKKRSFDGVGHQQYQGRHVFGVYFWTPGNEAVLESVISSAKDDTSSSLFLDSKKRSFDGVGHQQCQRRHVFAVYFWTPRNEALMESVISCVKDHTSSQFYFWTPRNEALMESVIKQYQGRHVFAVYLWTPRNEALMESVISSIKDDTSSQFISGFHETKL